jgi:hypothetical protein
MNTKLYQVSLIITTFDAQTPEEAAELFLKHFKITKEQIEYDNLEVQELDINTTKPIGDLELIWFEEE